MEVVVNDTNILIDLYNAGLLGYCRLLSLGFYTLDVVINEIEDYTQRMAVEALVTDGTLSVRSLSGFQVERVMNKVDEYDGVCNLSPEDISVMIFAKENGYRLLTGDKALRAKAIQENVKVSGVLFLTDMMVAESIVDYGTMADALERMIELNKRLPTKTIRNRIAWLRNETDVFLF